jgi:phenylpyruvate tautomerase PptA (4-oxalocrotonate tautomerase family)
VAAKSNFVFERLCVISHICSAERTQAKFNGIGGVKVPIVTITVRKPKTSEFKNTVLDAVGAALVGAGASPNDRFQRVIELDPDNFRFDPTFPDLTRPRTDDFVLIELLLGLGRSVKVKKKIVADTMEALSRKGFDPEHVMIVFQDVPWENWSPGGGRIPHA